MHPCFTNAKAWSRASTVINKQVTIGWIFKQLLACITLGLPKKNMWILTPRSSNQVDTQGVSPQDQRIFQTDLGFLDHSYREYLMKQTFECCFAFPVSVGSFLPVTALGEIVTEKWPLAKCFQAVYGFKHKEIWENYLALKNERHQQSVFSGLCLTGTL